MNGMMPLEYVISEVKLKLVKLQDLLTGLYELRSQSADRRLETGKSEIGGRGRGGKSQIANCKSQIGGRETAPMPRRLGGLPMPAAERKPAIANGLGGRVLEVCAGLGERFDQNDVAKAMPREEAGPIRGALAYAEKKGLLVVVEKGRPGKPTVYRLAGNKDGTGKSRNPQAGKPTLPNTKEREAMLKIKPSAAELDRLQDELEAAIEERDGHQTAGRDGLLAVAQKKVDRLVQQIKGS